MHNDYCADWVSPRVGGGKVRSDCSMDIGFPFGEMKVQELQSGTVIPDCERTKCHWTVHFKIVKMVDFLM